MRLVCVSVTSVYPTMRADFWGDPKYSFFSVSLDVLSYPGKSIVYLVRDFNCSNVFMSLVFSVIDEVYSLVPVLLGDPEYAGP